MIGKRETETRRRSVDVVSTEEQTGRNGDEKVKTLHWYPNRQRRTQGLMDIAVD